ncbi:MAG: hypothetical protein A2V98_11175 [Planctomycetes bacterium RBG_16_64_12]|nr:MAG: hypothetical protein A2V98_11175 [Planctomycetes bacterium RBG_16_64_12]
MSGRALIYNAEQKRLERTMCEDTSVTGSQQDVAVQHVVILIHGIRSLGRWHQSVDDVMGSENVRVIIVLNQSEMEFLVLLG